MERDENGMILPAPGPDPGTGGANQSDASPTMPYGEIVHIVEAGDTMQVADPGPTAPISAWLGFAVWVVLSDCVRSIFNRMGSGGAVLVRSI